MLDRKDKVELLNHLLNLIEFRGLIEFSTKVKDSTMMKNLDNGLPHLKVQFDNGRGLCAYINEMYYGYCIYEMQYIKELFKKWEHYSGNEYYPIVLKSSPLSSSQIYNYYVIRRLSMWGLDEYGQLRWNLIKFLISEIIKDINSSVIDQTIY